MQILETERLVIREITPDDAPFVLELLNTHKFIKYIADRGVRKRFLSSYAANGYGLYAVELKGEGRVIGKCRVCPPRHADGL